MPTEKGRIIVVLGATGLQGGAVTRHLLSGGWSVRAVTRKPKSARAEILSARGADVRAGDMEKLDTLVPIFQGAYGVFSVQNPVTSGVEREIRQGKNVADVALQAGIQHVVYASAGIGRKGTGVPSWESKLAIEEYMKSLGIPLTILRPMAFMELMTEQKFFPAVSTWHAMPRIMGSETKVVWLSVDDLGYIVAKVFSEPEHFIGREFQLASDVQSIDECRQIYRSIRGKDPSRFPMPLWMYERYGFIGQDTSTMWRWLRSNTVDLDIGLTLSLHPRASTVQAWLERKR